MQDQAPVRKAARLLRSVVGQRNFYRVARLLMFEAQFDVLNYSTTNGEQYLQETILKCVERPVVFDIGANVGDWTDSLLKFAESRDVIVHAFEPCSGTFDMLKKRAAHWKGVRLVPKACSDHQGTARLSVESAGSGTNSLTCPVGVDFENVELTTVDCYCREQSIPRINLLKVDAEGHDFNVLLGAASKLQDQSVDVIQFEYNHRWIPGRRLLRDVFDYLQPFGYRLGKLNRNGVQFYPGWHWELETYRESNYVACAPDWSQKFSTIPVKWVPY
jgi:FkbM family methyltransferase